MSLYELISTSAAMRRMDEKSSKRPTVTDEEWDQSVSLITDLAKFDPSLRV